MERKERWSCCAARQRKERWSCCAARQEEEAEERLGLQRAVVLREEKGSGEGQLLVVLLCVRVSAGDRELENCCGGWLLLEAKILWNCCCLQRKEEENCCCLQRKKEENCCWRKRLWLLLALGAAELLGATASQGA